MINVEDFKEMIYKLQGYRENNNIYDFYYDETNNYRKVRIKEDGFNDNSILTENYVLGGICIKKEDRKDISEIINNIKVQPNQEIKSKMFFRGKNKFEECINNTNLTIVLDWILDNAFIHYLDMDNFYFTIIDIVDSLIDNSIAIRPSKDIIEFMKNELYLLLKANVKYFIKLCNKTQYPNISKENVKIFCDEIISLIDENIYRFDDGTEFILDVLRQLLKNKCKSKELTFLKNNEKMTIVKGYYSNRQQRCIIFQKSKHIFDREDEDEKLMENNLMILKDGKVLRNYIFVDSKEYLEIQISDIIISIIAKYLSFLSNNSIEYINENIKNLKQVGKNNLKKLIQVINKSDKENKFFIASVNSFQVNNHRNLMNQHIEFLLDIN